MDQERPDAVTQASRTVIEPGPAVTTAAAVRSVPRAGRAPVRRKLTFNEQRELDALPSTIESLEKEHRALEARVADPAFYKEGPDSIHRVMTRMDEVSTLLLVAYERWDELDSARR